VRLDVLLGESLPTPADVAGRLVVVIDVLRASTVMVDALANGARAVVPFGEVDEVVTAAKRYGREEVCLAGERRSLPIPGFDVGNSPLAVRPEQVAGKIVLMTTTNGTAALTATHGAWRVLVGAFTNLSVTVNAVADALRAGRNALLVCAGQERRFALEDAACAGVMVSRIVRSCRAAELGDAAQLVRRVAPRYLRQVSLLAHDAAHARALEAAGFAADVAACLVLDRAPLLATYSDRQVTGERILAPA
jgi:2-phosphosulfolactate phosphatase